MGSLADLIHLFPFDKMPIWARLQFAKMISDTYWWDGLDNDEPFGKPRHVSEVTVYGFRRIEDSVWIYYQMYWPNMNHVPYLCCLKKDDGVAVNAANM
jgi:hypothetical protein